MNMKEKWEKMKLAAQDGKIALLALGVGIVGAGVGIGLAIATKSNNNELDENIDQLWREVNKMKFSSFINEIGTSSMFDHLEEEIKAIKETVKV